MARFVNFWLLASSFWLWSLRFSEGSWKAGADRFLHSGLHPAKLGGQLHMVNGR